MPKSDIPFETLIADLHGSDWQKRCDAARLLGQSRDPRAVEALWPDLRDPDWRVRRNAVQALGALKSPQAVGPLLEALNDRTNTVRTRAIVGLGRIKDPQALPALIAIVVNSQTCNDYQLLRFAQQAIRKFGRKAGPDLVEAIKKSPNYTLIRLLVECGIKGQGSLLIELAGHTDTLIRRAAIEALGMGGDPDIIPFLIQSLTGSDEHLQAGALRALGQLDAVQAVPQILDLLKGDDLYGQRSDLYHAVTEAFQALSGIAGQIANAFPGKSPLLFNTGGAAISLPEAVSLMGNENFQQINDMLASAEARLEDAGRTLNLPPALIQMAADKTWGFGAMFADARNAKTERVKVLIGLLESEAPLARAAAALTLPWYGDPQALEPLERAAADPDETVRRAAAWAHAALKKALENMQQLRGRKPLGTG